MTVRLYKSTDVSAPVMSGQAGALVTLLDACLVNGYGSQLAAGWTKSFSGTSLATYRQGTGSNQFYLHVNDAAPATPMEARIFGTETATAVLVGTGQFPMAPYANGIYVRKSNTADATARPWILIADDRTIYLFTNTGYASSTYFGTMFGEYYSIKSTPDAYRTMIIARGTETHAGSESPTEDVDMMYNHIGYALSTHYLVRDDQGNPGVIQFNKQGDIGATLASGKNTMSGYINWYNRPDGNMLYLAPIRVIQSTPIVVIRGYFRGLWHFCHPITNVSDGDTFNGLGPLIGKSFLIIKQSGNGGVYVIETSNTWETNV